MIRTVKEKLIAICTECGHEREPSVMGIKNMRAVLQDEGWLIRKEEGGEWEHFCPECAKEMR